MSEMNATNATSTSSYITITGNGDVSDYISFESWGTGTANGGVSVEAKVTKGLSPELYFKYVKKKFGTLQSMRLNARLKKLEKAFNAAVENGQTALGEKMMREILRETRESMLYAKGIKHFVELEDVRKFKNKIRNGHISDTKFEKYTRVIPKDVLEKKKKVEDLFDGYVIYHYWNENQDDVSKMTAQERADMRDPILFGVIKESERLYFIADWEDEYCDLTFEEMIDVIGKDDKEYTIPREPKLNLD